MIAERLNVLGRSLRAFELHYQHTLTGINPKGIWLGCPYIFHDICTYKPDSPKSLFQCPECGLKFINKKDEQYIWFGTDTLWNWPISKLKEIVQAITDTTIQKGSIHG